MRKSKRIAYTLIVFIGAACIYVLFSVKAAMRYTFLDGSFPLWQAVVTVSVALSVTFVILLLRRAVINKKFWSIVGFFISFLLISFALLFMTVSNLNCWLDTSPHKQLGVIIEDKNIDHNTKSPDEYEFIFTVDGKQYSINVPRSVYYSYEKGDLFHVELHRGAFQDPFFIADVYD